MSVWPVYPMKAFLDFMARRFRSRGAAEALKILE
jgi:hypothetical protein